MSYEKDFIPPTYPITSPYPLPIISDVSRINDYLTWSIINLFCGGGLLGILPLIFSLLCRTNKKNNDLRGAETMSTLAFVFNIFITIGGVIGWTAFVISMSIYISTLHNLT